jgi:hypothetical protein
MFYRAYGAESTDGGQTFSNEPLATTPSLPEGSDWGGPLIVSVPRLIEATWMDTRTGTIETELGIVPVR